MIKIEFKKKRGKGGIRVPHNTVEVNLDLMKIKEISFEPLRQLQDLERISIRNNNDLEYFDLTPLSSCKNLRVLHLSFNGLRSIDLSPLGELEHLEAIILTGNKNMTAIDLEPLRGRTSFTTFDSKLNPINEIDVSPLVDCINLRTFAADSGTALFVGNPDVQIEDLPEVLQRQMEGVVLKPYTMSSMGGSSLDKSVVPFNTTIIDFSVRKITTFDLGPLRLLKGLEVLKLNDNYLQKIKTAPLADIESLRIVDLSMNNILELDVTPFLSLPSLEEFKIDEFVYPTLGKGRKLGDAKNVLLHSILKEQGDRKSKSKNVDKLVESNRKLVEEIKIIQIKYIMNTTLMNEQLRPYAKEANTIRVELQSLGYRVKT